MVDGRYELYVALKESGENVVKVLSLKTLQSTSVKLPDHEGNFCWDLSVRPDGRRLAYVEGGGGATDVTRLWTISSSGSETIPLTDGRTNVWNPTWSADGRAIFFVSNRGGSMDLWRQTVADDGTPEGDAIALTSGIGMSTAAFSPNGQKLAYTRGQRVANVFRVPIPTNRPSTWTDAERLTVGTLRN